MAPDKGERGHSCPLYPNRIEDAQIKNAGKSVRAPSQANTMLLRNSVGD